MNNRAGTLLFIHGWATDPWVWEDAARNSGENIINLALPGHGGKERWDTPDLAPALREIERAIAGLPERSVTGVGWSLGAQTLIDCFPALGSKFNGFVLVSATPCFTAKDDFQWGQSRALVKRMILDMKKDPASTVERFYPLNFTAEELEHDMARAFIRRYGFPGPVDCSTEVPGCFPVLRYDEVTVALEALYRLDLRDRLEAIDIPTLIIHGRSDGVTPFEAAEFLADNIKRARLAEFENAGHAPFITEQERFIAILKGFTQEL